MVILLFFAAALNLSAFSAPVITSIDALDPHSTLSILGRDIPIPECVNPARYRTMQQIVLSCLATIFACTWVSLHPNVPDPRKSGWQIFTMRMRTMFWALIGPEFITIWAFRQRIAATKHAKEYNDKFKLTPQSRSVLKCIKNLFCRPEDEKPDQAWTLTHGFLLEMYGLVHVKDGQPVVHPPMSESECAMLEGRHWELRDAGELEKAEEVWKTLDINNLRPSLPPGILLTISDLCSPFNMTQDEINDKSKGDFFTKLIVVIQTSWFIIQCIARWVQRLHVTELEIVTLAFAVLNIITYILWWNKPQDMHVAIPVFERCDGCGAAIRKKDKTNCEGIVESHSHGGQASVGDQCSSTVEAYVVLPPKKEQRKCSHHTSTQRVPPALPHLGLMLGHAILRLPHVCWVFIKAVNPFFAYSVMIGDILDLEISPEVNTVFYSCTGGTGKSAVGLAIGLTGLLFGGVHLLPIWLSTFSSARDKYLWIASTIYVLVEPVLVSTVLSTALRLWGSSGPPTIIRFAAVFPHTIGFLLYVVARLILIFLAFTNLCSLPSSAFANVEWSTFSPHI